MSPHALFRRAVAPQSSASPAAPRAALVFAHPDDETLALGARIGRFGSACLIHVTDGAPRNGEDSRAHGFATVDQYRCAREHELVRALGIAGAAGLRREPLGIPDQEASLWLPQTVRRLFELLRGDEPQVIFTHPYEGGHPDHDACAFVVHRAVSLLERAGSRVPLVIEAAFYHEAGGRMETSSFLPTPEATLDATFLLSADDRDRKARMLAAFETQRETLKVFSCERERFRVAPHYDFHRPPHPAPVLYDRFPWGSSSARFCDLVRAADIVLASA